MSKRIRRVGSIKSELLKKSREAALAAVQIFNNPTPENAHSGKRLETL